MRKITLLAGLLLTTLQAGAQVLLSENFDTALNWTVTHPTGTATSPGWTRVTSGANPTCSPQQGAGMALFNAYDIEPGNAYNLRSPAITFGGNFYKAAFKMYRDPGYSSSADNVKVYFNTLPNLVGATLLTTVHRSTSLSPVEATQGWYSYDAYLPNGVTGEGYIMMFATSDYGNNVYIDNISIEQVNVINDAAMTNVNLNSVMTQGTYDISGTYRNLGSNAVTSIDLNWQVTGGPINTQSLSGINVAPGEVIEFTHSTQWTPATGQYSMTVWVSNTNGGDSNDDNDYVEKTGYVVNEIFPKTVVYEEATGTWCGWCVRGHIGLKDMAHYHDDGSWIGIAVHNDDPMMLVEYDTAIGSFISGYPSGAMNRVQGEVDPGLSSIEPAYQAELLKTPLAKVAVGEQSWDPITRQISFDAQAIFALDINNANFNLAAVILENGVHGTTPTWRQRNYYAGGTITDWEGINWGAYPAYIPATTMIYNHVGRALLGGFAGVNGSVPASVQYNVPYSHTFTHTLPAGQVAENVEIVVLLLDKNNGQIANAVEVELDTTLGTAAFNGKRYGVYPNPSTGIFNINTENPVTVTVTDLLGKVVYTKNNVSRDNSIDLSGLQRGVYMAQIADGNATATEKIILN